MSAFLDIKERDEELYRHYKKAFQQPDMTHAKAVRQAIHSRTSRYWVSPYYVYRDICARLRGHAAKYDPASRRKSPRPCRACMYEELFQHYKRLASRRDFRGYSPYFIISFVINRPAPQFYIDFVTADRIIARKRREARQAFILSRRRTSL